MIKLKSLITEGFKANSGLAKAIQYYKKNPGDLQQIVKKLADNKVTSDTVFKFAALFPRDTFKIDYIRTGKLESQISRTYFSGSEQTALDQAKALKEFVLALDKLNDSKNWPASF